MQDLQGWRRQFGPDLVGEAPRFVEALRIAERVADSDATVVISGETGTGKDLLAHTIHRASQRRHKPYIPINCAAFQDSLLETELFGHVRGAFTGASQARPGRFLAAHGGTLFLDEVGELSLAAQTKLLRVLEDHKVTPVGSDLPVEVDVRVIAATHRDLLEMVQEGAFRADLYYRLCIVQLQLPPLRERGDDLERITDVAIERVCAKLGKSVQGIESEARTLLRAHRWPGNVRELRHCLESTVLLASAGAIRAEDVRIPRSRPSSPTAETERGALRAAFGEALDARSMVQKLRPSGSEASYNLQAIHEAVDRIMIAEALDAANGNKTEAAALLGLNRTTLVEKIRKYGVCAAG